MTSTAQIRQHFIDYFTKQGHEAVQSASLVPQNDPTLLFTAAGMVPFKNVFTGLEKRPYTRAVTSQKCVRAGGKHNDLENVGYTARHHTFFEMLGNFSFGDYFKEEAIPYSWDLLTKEFGLDPNRLLITVFHTDDEAANIWKKVTGFSDNKILRIATSDNFWSAGDLGPCGPCSEIFYDHGDHLSGGPPGSPDEDGDRFVEIWNLVFMQYDQLAAKGGGKGERVDLPKPSIDTGMGLERIAAVMQGVHDNYDIDLFKNLINRSQELLGESGHQTSHRVIADHLRSTCFLIADGVSPSNEGRGYVLRRIMRRAMRHIHMLGGHEPTLFKLVPSLVQEMGEAYPELRRAQGYMEETIKLEEARFQKTLGRGMKILDEALEELPEGALLPGDVAFKLYDTYGFPLDLTQDILKADERLADEKGFHEAMQKQKEEAKASWVGSGDAQSDAHWLELRNEIAATEFLGYHNTMASGVVQAIVLSDSVVNEAHAGDEIAFICNQTPFYAESGGQIGDTGVIENNAGLQIKITDTKKAAKDFFVHYGVVEKGSLKVGDQVELKVDAQRRQLIRANHSATHLLHAVLREQLGTQVVQKGSLVAPDKLRFDYSFNAPLSKEQIQSIETQVNGLIRGNTAAKTHLMNPEEAIEAGAMALFGEKYGDEVRVVSMGEGTGKEYSVELCGGTHVERTGDIGLFKIISDTGVAAGIRRIEAYTGPGAEQYLADQSALVFAVSEILKTQPNKLADKLTSFVEEKKSLERKVKQLQEKIASGDVSSGGVKQVNGINFASRILDDVEPRDLKKIVDELKKQIGSGVVAVCSTVGGKGSLVVGVTQDLTSEISAVDFVRIGSQALGGKGGGGRPDMAQAGGPNADAAQQAIDAIEAGLSS